MDTSATITDTKLNYPPPTNTVELPEHVKKQLMATGSSGASHAASTSVLATTDNTGTDTKPIPNRNFLAEAASKSRGAELARKRLQVLDNSNNSSNNDNNINNNDSTTILTAGSVSSTSTVSGNTNSSSTTTPNTTVTYPVIYKFQEGFTNAVKRSLKINDFL